MSNEVSHGRAAFDTVVGGCSGCLFMVGLIFVVLIAVLSRN